MPNWKKVIVSGSNAVINNITGSGHLNILNNSFTVNAHDSTELEVEGNISASNNGNLSGKDILGYGSLTIGTSATIGSNLAIDNRLAIGTTNTNNAQLTIASDLSDGVENGILMVKAVEGGVTASGILGAIGFDSTGSNSADDANFNSIADDLFKAPSYIAGMAAELQDEDNKGGHLVFGTKALGATDGQTTPERMRITSEGKIGIGTITADQLLHMSGSNPQICIEESSTEFIRIGVSATGNDMCIGWDDSDDLHLGCFSSTVDNTISTKMLIQSDGKVGIGDMTGSMNSLQVNIQGTDFSNGIMIVRDDTSVSTNNILGGIGFDSTDGAIPSSILESSAYIAAYAAEFQGTGDKGGYLVFGTSPINQNQNTVSSERMRITAGGNVGIGTTSPDYPLEVKDSNSGTFLPVARIESSGAGNAEGLRISFPGLNTPGTGADYISFCRSNEVEIDVLEGDGTGGIRFTGNAAGTFSDIRNKDNIVTLTDTSSSLGIVKGLDVLEYTLKTDIQEIPTRRVGFSAQQLLEVYPHPVTTFDEKNEKYNLQPGDEGFWYHKVAEGSLTPLLVQAIKELTSKIESLETRIQELES